MELRSRDLTIKEYTIQDGDILKIGRDPGNEIKVTDRTASRVHACLARKGDDLIVWDKGSRNGTLVNGKKVQSAQLNNGDIVRVGVEANLRVFITSKEERESTVTGERERKAGQQ